MPHITVGQENSQDIQLYYEDHGAGDPVVLIHGWPLSGRSWEKQVPVLLQSGHRVITYDRRGFGLSDKPTTGYDYDTLAKDLDILLNRLDLTNVTLVGFSMGGGEVARYLGKFDSKRVKNAVFVAAITPFLLKTKINPEGVDRRIFEQIKQGLYADRPSFFADFFSNFYNKDELKGTHISKEALRLSWMIACESSPIASISCVDSWLTDFREDLQKIHVPTLVIHGDSDRIVPLEASGKRLPSMIKNSKLVTISGAPHGLNWTHADRLNQELLAFLGGSVGDVGLAS